MNSAIYSAASPIYNRHWMTISWHVGDVVRKLREAKGWNQTKLGEKAGLNKATIVTLENTPDETKTGTLGKTAKALGLDIKGLYSLVPPDAEVKTRDAGVSVIQGVALPGVDSAASQQRKRAPGSG